MKQDDWDRFERAFGTLAELFEKEISPIIQAAYFKALEKFTIQQVESAISDAIGTLRFWPKPVELIELIVGGKAQIEDNALIQATNVLEAVKRVGGYQSVQFEDNVTNAVIHYGFGGWVKLCNEMTGKDEKWFLKDFQEMYKMFIRGGRELSSHLPGRIETQNIAHGHNFSDPVLFISSDNEKTKLLN